MRYILLFVTISVACLSGKAQDKQTENTLKLVGSSPKATLSDIAWIEGNWKGEAFGGEFEENWSAPFGDSMIGSFKLVVDGKTSFYELIVIRQVENSLILQLKHFTNEFNGWEEKEEKIEFPFIKKDGNRVYFDGITFENIDKKHIVVYLALKQKDDSIKEVKFDYHK